MFCRGKERGRESGGGALVVGEAREGKEVSAT